MTTYVDPRGPLASPVTEYDLVFDTLTPTIGLLSNSFDGCDRFLDALQLRLEVLCPQVRVRRYSKPTPSDRLSGEEGARIAEEVDGLIAAYGH